MVNPPLEKISGTVIRKRAEIVQLDFKYVLTDPQDGKLRLWRLQQDNLDGTGVFVDTSRSGSLLVAGLDEATELWVRLEDSDDYPIQRSYWNQLCRCRAEGKELEFVIHSTFTGIKLAYWTGAAIESLEDIHSLVKRDLINVYQAVRLAYKFGKALPGTKLMINDYR